MSIADRLKTTPFGPYMTLADDRLNLISVFDDLKYDRADADMMSPAMRMHAIDKLARLGFKQTSGTVLKHRDEDVQCFIPKFHALGASPFDITRYTPKRPQDYYILTPTQTACHYVDCYDVDQAVSRTKDLIATQPINVYRLMDYLDKSDAHNAFLNAIGHLRFFQREAVEGEPLRRRRALG